MQYPESLIREIKEKFPIGKDYPYRNQIIHEGLEKGFISVGDNIASSLSADYVSIGKKALKLIREGKIDILEKELVECAEIEKLYDKWIDLYQEIHYGHKEIIDRKTMWGSE